jgi:hypothetical protein
MAKVSYTTATLAAEIDTTPKELRKFLRSDLSGVDKVGKGGRYAIELTATQLTATKKGFAKWVAAADAARAARAELIKAEAADHADDEVIGDTDDDTADLDLIDDPTDADLDLIDEA